MNILEVIAQAKAQAIADRTYTMPNRRQILRQAGLSSGYFNQRSTAAKEALAAWEAAETALIICKHTPLAVAKLAVYDRLEAELKTVKQQRQVLEQENDRLILELALFRQFEAEWNKMKREMSRFTQQQAQEAA